ncbi:MAG: hypothetical protein J6S79_06530, partial [Lachnospiraceae bacterium]|nr:hypothetical protein [Lachnospiraceae bacterium]
MLFQNSLMFGTLFESLWEFLSSGTAVTIYFVTLFLCIAAMISTVLIMVNTDKKNNAQTGGVRFDEEGKLIEDDGITSRFHSLVQTDIEMGSYEPPVYNNRITLDTMCRNFRDYAASQLGLYYSEEDVRKFIAGLGVSHLVVMQGLSGTGKTSMATAFGDYLKNHSTVISVQPMWKERSDIIGYFNEFTKRFSEGTLLKKLYEARYTDEIYVIVLDEMNIARVEYYFADFLSQMELNPQNRYLEVVSDTWPDDPKLLEHGMLRIPENVWFVGTANNDDSTFAISDKVYDRAMVMNLDRKAEIFQPNFKNGDKISFRHFTELINQARAQYRLSDEMQQKIAA